MLFSILALAILLPPGLVQNVYGSVVRRDRDPAYVDLYGDPLKFEFAYLVKTPSGEDEQIRSEVHDSAGIQGKYIVHHPHNSWQTMNFSPNFSRRFPLEPGNYQKLEIPDEMVEEIVIHTGSSAAAVQIVVEQETVEVTKDSSSESSGTDMDESPTAAIKEDLPGEELEDKLKDSSQLQQSEKVRDPAGTFSAADAETTSAELNVQSV